MFSRLAQVRHFSVTRLCQKCENGVGDYFTQLIGSREIVGFGMNGQPTYFDSVIFPYPAIRFREMTPTIKAIREKEKGNWKYLTKDEKKILYRVSFCQTLAEVEAPNGEWKEIIGTSLIIISACLWLYFLVNFMTFDELPKSFSPECQKAQLKRLIDLRMNPITGLASKWDYEKKEWKK